MSSQQQPTITETMVGSTGNIIYQWTVDKDMKPTIVPQIELEGKPECVRMGRSWWSRCATTSGKRDDEWKVAYMSDQKKEEEIQRFIKEHENKHWTRWKTRYINRLENSKYFGHQIDYWYNYEKESSRKRKVLLEDGKPFIGSYSPTYKYAPCRPYHTIRNRYGGIDGFILHTNKGWWI